MRCYVKHEALMARQELPQRGWTLERWIAQLIVAEAAAALHVHVILGCIHGGSANLDPMTQARELALAVVRFLHIGALGEPHRVGKPHEAASQPRGVPVADAPGRGRRRHPLDRTHASVSILCSSLPFLPPCWSWHLCRGPLWSQPGTHAGEETSIILACAIGCSLVA